jgi:thiol-disulfide isomerase/thioredoxin
VMAAMGMGNMMPNLSDVHLAQKTVGEETITIDGQKHDCWIVQTDIGSVEMPGAMGAKLNGGKVTSWIDKKLLLDLQSDATMNMSMAGGISTETHIKTVKKDLQIDGAIADATFAFTPPDGAKQVDKMSLFGSVGSTADLEGESAPDFTVKSLEGKQFRLADLKGKPVLLDFWASWCGPCKQSMPVVEKIAKDYKDQLTVLGVNAAEEREVAAEFLKRNPMSYPSALSTDSTVLKDYKVDALPTFVLIGADGKIAAYQSGYGGEEMLRAMLQKAGLAKK